MADRVSDNDEMFAKMFKYIKHVRMLLKTYDSNRIFQNLLNYVWISLSVLEPARTQPNTMGNSKLLQKVTEHRGIC